MANNTHRFIKFSVNSYNKNLNRWKTNSHIVCHVADTKMKKLDLNLHLPTKNYTIEMSSLLKNDGVIHHD